MHGYQPWLGRKHSVCGRIAMRRAGWKGLVAIQSKSSRNTSSTSMRRNMTKSKEKSPGWVSSLNTTHPELPGSKFPNYRQWFAEMLHCHTLFFLLISVQRDVAVIPQNHEYKTCLVFPCDFFTLFLQSLFYIHTSPFLWSCSSQLLGFHLFLCDFCLRDKPKLCMSSYFSWVPSRAFLIVFLVGNVLLFLVH